MAAEPLGALSSADDSEREALLRAIGAWADARELAHRAALFEERGAVAERAGERALAAHTAMLAAIDAHAQANRRACGHAPGLALLVAHPDCARLAAACRGRASYMFDTFTAAHSFADALDVVAAFVGGFPPASER